MGRENEGDGDPLTPAPTPSTNPSAEGKHFSLPLRSRNTLGTITPICTWGIQESKIAREVRHCRTFIQKHASYFFPLTPSTLSLRRCLFRTRNAIVIHNIALDDKASERKHVCLHRVPVPNEKSHSCAAGISTDPYLRSLKGAECCPINIKCHHTILITGLTKRVTVTGYIIATKNDSSYID